jgi:catechol 2,3-dioxygenase-like lactoylglutathione lyase family enzyme
MGFNHMALAVQDLEANHRFWTEGMGFRLVDAFDVPTGTGDGWARHVFYDTGDGTCLSLLHLHDESVPAFDPSISRGLGLPGWVNHLAFDAPGAEALDEARDRWLDVGLDVVRMDHGRSLSIYAEDPNGNTIEWCWQHAPFTDEDAAGALGRLFGPQAMADGPEPVFEVFAASAART